MHEASAARFRLRRERWEEREAEGGIGGSYSCWCCWDCCERHDGQVVVLGNSVSMIAPVFMLEQKVSGHSPLMQQMRQRNPICKIHNTHQHLAPLHPCTPALLHPKKNGGGRRRSATPPNDSPTGVEVGLA